MAMNEKRLTDDDDEVRHYESRSSTFRAVDGNREGVDRNVNRDPDEVHPERGAFLVRREHAVPEDVFLETEDGRPGHDLEHRDGVGVAIPEYQWDQRWAADGEKQRDRQAHEEKGP